MFSIRNTRVGFSLTIVLALCLSGCGARSTPESTATAVSLPASTATPVPQQPTRSGANKGTLTTVRIDSPALAGNLIGEKTERPISVYLPPTYDSTTTRYPVVYYLPGFADTTMGISLPGSIDTLIEARKIQEMIVVVVPGNNLVGGGFYVNSPVTGNWEDFVVQDVVGYVDRQYRTLARAESRGLSGHSMGGFGIAQHRDAPSGSVRLRLQLQPGSVRCRWLVKLADVSA